MAVLIRMELATPEGDLFQPDIYNRLFTMHGVLMIFFFLIPGIPAVLGNFLIPLMIGAKDLAFPRINLLSLVPLLDRRRSSTLWALLHGGVDTGWTFYTPLSTNYVDHVRPHGGRRHLHRRLLVDPHGPELHRHDPPHARAGPHVVPAAALRLGPLRDEHHPDPRDAGRRDRHPSRRGRARASTSGSSTRSSAAIRSSSSTCSGSTRTPPSTS